MILLIVFAFIAGLVTILSPCILPVLPIVLSGSVTGGKSRPLGVVTGFIASFTFFTLFLTTLVKTTGIDPDTLRIVSVVVISVFGLSLLVPKLQTVFERLATRMVSLGQKGQQTAATVRSDFVAGILVGISLGLLWTPCVGPILASIISLALTGIVTGTAAIITLAYASGTAIPMLAITYGGRELLAKTPWLTQNTPLIQKIFGVLMIATALAIAGNLDRKLQTYILDVFPNYGVGLTKFEDNPTIKAALNNLKPAKPASRERGKPMYDYLTDIGRAPEFIPGGEWFNGHPLTIQGLRGKVVLVDFWTYTCINCIRTLPYLKSWWEKYKDKGLVIVGVHTPEFEFEKDAGNVAKAIKDFGLTYPVMQDNNYATWDAYANRYWPAKYLVDKNGNIRYSHFGEGKYDETEKAIQALLAEAGTDVSDMQVTNPTYQVQSRTPELYLGYWRIANFASPERIVEDESAIYSVPTDLKRNTFAYLGNWTVGYQRAMPTKGATLLLHFDAKEVFLVMRPKNDAGNVKVYLDDTLVSNQAGEDVKNGTVTVTADRLYKLIKLPAGGAHILKLEFLDDNLELYAFTFG